MRNCYTAALGLHSNDRWDHVIFAWDQGGIAQLRGFCFEIRKSDCLVPGLPATPGDTENTLVDKDVCVTFVARDVWWVIRL